MKSFAGLQFVVFLTLLVYPSEASLLGASSHRTKKLREPIRTAEPPYVCLESPSQLPDCNFASGNEPQQVEELFSSRTQRSIPNFELSSGATENSIQDLIGEVEQPRHPRGLLIVYKVEGCIPSRLPFTLPLCKPEDSIDRSIEVRSLLPFLGNDASRPPRVFPKLEVNKWQRMMKGPWTSPKKDGRYETFAPEGLPEVDVAPAKKLSKRKKYNENTEKRIIRKKLESHKIHEKSSLNDDEKFPYGKTSINDEGNLGIARLGSEFPYRLAIDYDPKKLQKARPGSEFPYSQAIQFDPEKLENRRKVGLLKSAEENLHFYYFGAATGRKFQRGQFSPNFVDHEAIHRTKASGNEALNLQIQPENRETARYEGQIENIGTAPVYSRRFARSPIESTTKKGFSMVNEESKIPRRFSEFPYDVAIPFDPAKFRRPRASEWKNDNNNNDEIAIFTIPKVFPYARAIPYDPMRLTLRLEKNQRHDDEKSGIERWPSN